MSANSAAPVRHAIRRALRSPNEKALLPARPGQLHGPGMRRGGPGLLQRLAQVTAAARPAHHCTSPSDGIRLNGVPGDGPSRSGLDEDTPENDRQRDRAPRIKPEWRKFLLRSGVLA